MSGSNLLAALTDNLVIDKDACVFCGKCAETCVLDNIRLRRAPCTAACPMGLNVQGYVQLVARGREEEARSMVARMLPFPGVICRICEHPCENACSRRLTDGAAVNINGIKRALFARDGVADIPRGEPSGKSVAVVGSGPAGLMAAHDLCRAGHAVTVYEQAARPGGLLRSLLPVWRLPEAEVDAVVDALADAGVVFRCGERVADEAGLAALQARHDAVILAPGAGAGRRAAIPGEELAGVFPAFDFLAAVRAGRGPALGGRVLVLGGGATALDCAEGALRQGAREVVVVYRRDAAHLRAPQEDVAQARKAGVRFAFTWAPVGIRPSGGGLCLTVRHDMALLPPECRDYPDFIPDETREMPADAIIVAVGQEAQSPLGALLQAEADPVTLRVGEDTLFVAGDAVLGPSSAVHAMASGREAALSVIRLLAGEDLAYERGASGAFLDAGPLREAPPAASPRQEGAGHEFAGPGDFAEVTRFLSPAEARREAARCLNCGAPEGHYKNCWFCLPCEVECPEQALRVEIPYLLR